jgi:hypothetical protein
MVTYYRYMRLFPGRKNRVLFVTTTLEPTQEVVLKMDFDNISTSTIARDCSGIMTGTYTFDVESKRIEVNLVDAKRKGMSFTMAMTIGRTRRKMHWKLDWEDYFITNKGVKSEIPKDGLVQFFFSRVNSFRQ